MSCSPFFQCQLDYAREQITAFLPDTAKIWEPPDRSSATRTPEGDIDNTYPTAWTLIGTASCLVRLPRLRQWNVSTSQPLTIDYPVIIFPSDTVVNFQNRIQIITSVNAQLVGQNFDVLSAPLDTISFQRIVAVKLIENQ